MSEEDRLRWDAEYRRRGSDPDLTPALPAIFAPYVHLFPTRGQALDLACGPGSAAVWLARRGLHVRGLDISPVAVGRAEDLAQRNRVGDACQWDVVDLDCGLPAGPPADVVVCHRFRDARLDRAIIERLAPGGLLAIAVLSEVDHGSGPFRAAPGELRAAFGALTVVAGTEAKGQAWLLARAGPACDPDLGSLGTRLPRTHR